MNRTDVDADRVLGVKAQITSDITKLKNVQNTLKTRVLSSLSPYWRGQAYDAFAQQFNAFLTALDDFIKSSETLNTELDNAGKRYNSADAEVRRLITGLPN
jgi:WXG100 family type VII secretion target